MAIGAVCSYFKTGESQLVHRSLTKITNIAKSLLHSRDPYSYLLARLVGASCERFVETSLWPTLFQLSATSPPGAAKALVQFARSSFANKRALVWPAQVAGIDRLAQNTSFVLCTPTGSGKTTVATIGIVQGLFSPDPDPAPGLENWDSGGLILYLVPSRALAAEVETRLEQDLRGIAAEPIVVTGLYGGVDWGPTDAWVQGDRRTIVICTYEKADALIRYLGILFLHRVRLVVVDEARMVEQGHDAGLDDGSSRPYRLEQLGTRLLSAQGIYRFRIVALSAVAARAAPALARWFGANAEARPTTSDYRSTRQMLGHIAINAAGNFVMRYDLMDGRSLRFDDERTQDTPFVPSPFPALPGGLNTADGVEKRMRAPTLWAALHLAAEREDGTKPTVLISLTQSIETFATSSLEALDEWADEELPNYGGPDLGNELWTRCLASAEDYFTRASMEYRLLEKGIALHHGKMPGLLARRLKRVIDAGLVRVVVATSTLSEGVNIPVNYLLIPSLYRGTSRFTLQEFANLIGRAGRPGVASEGHALVVLQEPQRLRRGERLTRERQRSGYRELVSELEATAAAVGEGAPEDAASSALVRLLEALKNAWTAISVGGSDEQFLAWLEQVEVGSDENLGLTERFVDSLDAFLIAAIQEIEELRGGELPPADIEGELLRIWRHTYAFASAVHEERLRRVWLVRGGVIKNRYPDRARRRQIYRTSLSPSSATSLLEKIDTIRAKLLEGDTYAAAPIEERLRFVVDVLALISGVRPFQIGTKLGKAKNFRDWTRILRWWLARATLAEQPNPEQITNWHDFVAGNFIYRGVWGIGSVLGLLLDTEMNGEPIRALEMNDWPRSGLPWVAFWLKELVTWGTLEPVAAFLLARGDAVSRQEAELLSLRYYAGLQADLEPNDRIAPRRIRDWVQSNRSAPAPERRDANVTVEVQLVRSPAQYVQERLVVFPIAQADEFLWIDPAGYLVARSSIRGMAANTANDYQFELDVRRAQVRGERYLLTS
jgi:hypothetical protein